MKIDILILKLGVGQELGYSSVNISQTSSIMQLFCLYVKYFNPCTKIIFVKFSFVVSCELWAVNIFNNFSS